MRRFIAPLMFVVPAFCLVACEDGPTQTYSPAPPNALFNNGDTPAAVDEAGTSFGATYGGASKTEICSGAELQDQWNRMVNQPLVPPYHVAGVDISGVNYGLLTVEQAEKGPLTGMAVQGAPNPPTRLCQGANLGSGGNGGDIGGSLVTAWGNNNEFYMEWAIPTHKDYFNYINPGYNGAMDWSFTTDPGGCPQDATYVLDGNKHQYHWALNKPITKDGKVFNLDWNGYNTPGARFNCEADEIYRGLTSTYVPELYDNLPPSVHCKDTGRCPIFATGNDFVHPILGFRTISMYWDMGPPVLPQPSGSTPRDAYFFNIKYAPYSPAVSFLKMDAVGPIGTLNPIGNLTPPAVCDLALGGTFGDLKKNCINVFKDNAVDTAAMQKVLGNLTHDDQNFTFSIVGINQNYRPGGFDIGGAHQFDIIKDTDTVQDDAIAVDFTLDVRANGAITNDRYPTAKPGVYKRDNHGAGAVWREFGRLVQTDLAAKYVAAHGGTAKTLHDASCLFPSPTPPGFNPNTWRAAPGCTGFEGWIDEAYPNVKAADGTPVNPADPTVTDPSNVWDIASSFGNISDNGLRPGNPYGLWCLDPGTYSFCGQGFSGTLQGYFGALLDGAYTMVLQIMGNGDANNLPPGAGDYRYFFQKWTEAYAKYMESGASMYLGQHVAAADPTVPGSIGGPVPYFGNYVLNTDDFFFDSYGGNANRGEFIQYDYADMTHDPTGLNLSMLLVGTNLQEVHFYRRLDREERALFEVMENSDGRTATQAAWGLLHNGAAIVKDEWNQPRKNASLFTTNLAGSQAILAAGISADGVLAWNAVACATDADCTVGANKCDTAAGVCIVDATKINPCDPSRPLEYTAEYCATHLDPGCATTANGYGTMAPTDDAGKILTRANGVPILAGYCGIWNPSPLALGTANMKLINKDITPQQQQLETEAEVELPVITNPYNAKSAALPPIHVLVPWLPYQVGVGFPVATTGQQDIFVQTAELDFAGQVETNVIDFIPTADGHANILAYESQDFLGDVFLCYDQVTAANRAFSGRPGDILSAHMYTSVQDILTWLGNHPTAQDQCTIIIRWSPFNNYPDYITSLTNGVRVGIDQGAGSGRVTDLTVYVPGSGAPAQP